MPRARHDVVARPRLIDQLNTAVDDNGSISPKLTLITGPAGYGKSTLAVQWVSQLKHSIPKRPYPYRRPRFALYPNRSGRVSGTNDGAGSDAKSSEAVG